MCWHLSVEMLAVHECIQGSEKARSEGAIYSVEPGVLQCVSLEKVLYPSPTHISWEVSTRNADLLDVGELQQVFMAESRVLCHAGNLWIRYVLFHSHLLF